MGYLLVCIFSHNWFKNVRFDKFRWVPGHISGVLMCIKMMAFVREIVFCIRFVYNSVQYVLYKTGGFSVLIYHLSQMCGAPAIVLLLRLVKLFFNLQYPSQFFFVILLVWWAFVSDALKSLINWKVWSCIVIFWIDSQHQVPYLFGRTQTVFHLIC